MTPRLRSEAPVQAPNLAFQWLEHAFGLRDTEPPSDLTSTRQTHSATILDACGGVNSNLGEGDAILSATTGIAVGIRTADCVPVLLADPETRIVACVHAGWRGTAANIVGAAIREFVSRGAKPASVRAAIGPSIGACCYTVGEEVSAQFADHGVKPGRGALDLRALNESQLRKSGVSNIWRSEECTYCNADRFHSFRRDGDRAGRMISWIRSRAS